MSDIIAMSIVLIAAVWTALLIICTASDVTRGKLAHLSRQPWIRILFGPVAFLYGSRFEDKKPPPSHREIAGVFVVVLLMVLALALKYFFGIGTR